jgi:DNA-binding transcriptional LysR family regulator
MAKPLPPLNAVRAFEAASRHLNLSRAADELGVTQSAISKQVSALEDHIGVKLFEREPGGLRLTTEGIHLRESLRPAFALMQEAFVRFNRRSPRSASLRIAMLPSFASQFMVPRMEAFAQRFPDTELEIHASTRVVDLAREEMDLAVRFGLGGWEGVVATELAPGRLIACCSPEMFADHGGDPTRLLNNNRRIQTSTANEWRAWCEAEDVAMPDQPAFMMEDYLTAIRMALLGQGLVLLPDVLLHHHVQRGELKVFSTVPLPSDTTFHIVHAANASRRPGLKEAIAWLKAEGVAAAYATGARPASFKAKRSEISSEGR